MSSAIAFSTPIFSDEVLREMSFSTTMEHFGDIVQISDVLGDGFLLLDNKKLLVGTPFIIVNFSEATSKKHYDENGEALKFMVMRVITRDNDKFIVNDGSTGIAAQLRTLADKRIVGGVYVPNGLRVSEYEYVDEKGKKSAASTFYLDVSVEV